MKITVITVCYNSGATISETFDSVLAQDYDNFEYLVIDGGSKDNTLQIIRKYEKLFKGKMIYISEKDNGLYDAMNKGLALAKGDVVGFLNADDKFANKNILTKIEDTLKEKKSDGVYGDLLFLDHKTMSKPVRRVIAGDFTQEIGWQPPFPTVYIKKDIYENIGTYNLKYKIASDYDLTIRLIKNNYKLSYINEVLVHMRVGGMSTRGLKGYIRNFKDSLQVLRDNDVKCPLLFNILRTVRIFWQMILAKLS